MQTSLFRLYKNAYSGLSLNSWYLSIVMLINRAGTMVIAFMSVYCIRQLHFTVIQAGVIMMLFGFGAIAGAFVGGKLTDKIGFYDLQVGALFSGGILFLFLGYQHTFITLGIGAFVLSFFNDSVRPANATAVAQYSTDENRTRSYSLNRLAVNLGWAVGGALGGLLAAINYHLLFWVDGGTNILAALLLLILIPRVKQAKAIKNPEAKITEKTSAYQDRLYLLFIALGTLFSICFYEFFVMQPTFYKIEWHFNERFIGFLLSLNGILIAIIEMVLTHNLEGKRNSLVYIIIGISLATLGLVSLNILPHIAISAVVVVVLVTLGEIFSMPFMNTFWIGRASPHNRGEYAALYSMSWSAAQVIAPIFGGFVITFGGFSFLWWVLGAMSFLSAMGYGLLYAVHFRKIIGFRSFKNFGSLK